MKHHRLLHLLAVLSVAFALRLPLSQHRFGREQSKTSLFSTKERKAKSSSSSKASRAKGGNFIFVAEGEEDKALSSFHVASLADDGSSRLDELNALKFADVSLGDNFYDATLPKTKRSRTTAIQESDIERRVHVDANFFKLMNSGFERRMTSNQQATADMMDKAEMLRKEKDARFALLQSAAKNTEHTLELSKTKEEQLKELKKQRLMQRSGIMKMIPQALHKYIDYFASMRIKPDKKELSKNLFIGAFFSFVVWVNASPRSAFMYLVIGQLALLSSLLTRNMPQIEITPGMDKNKKVASWSSNSFKTATALTLLSALGTALATLVLVSVLPVNLAAKLKSAMVTSMVGTAYFTSFFEVFEDKNKNGMRWRKSLEGTLSAEVQAKLSEQVFGQKEMDDKYGYTYDPEIDDYPPVPKYIDELLPVEPGGSGELDEGEAEENFTAWKAFRKEARRPPVEEAPPETKWVGSKEGMYVKNIPTWLSTAYQKNVLKANAWRGKPTKFIKDFTEFEPVDGPYGFRDKRPEWFDNFGTGVWEEKVTASRRAARAFGTYRKTMWKLDNKVVLLPCDGADKDPHADGGKKDK